MQRTVLQTQQVGILPLPRVGGALSDALEGSIAGTGVACQTALAATKKHKNHIGCHAENPFVLLCLFVANQ